jgi:hypothetical protein
MLLKPSAGWERANINDLKKDPSLPLALNGESYHLREGQEQGKLRIGAPRGRGEGWFENATLYWGLGHLTVSAQGQDYMLEGKKGFNAQALPLSSASRVDLQFWAPPGLWIHGLNLDSVKGLHLDNFSFRGNRGDGLAFLDAGLMRQAQKALNYDLVLLHFGVNALRHGLENYHWYRVGLRKALEHLKENIPGALIGVVSVTDHAIKVDGEMVGNSSVPHVLAAQQAAARDAGVWFINLYQMMGGEGVIKSWVEGQESLANKDYTHPNRRGGARMAKYLRAALLGEPNPGPEPGSSAALKASGSEREEHAP